MSTVRILTPGDIPSAARLLAEAFFTNPAHVYMCPDTETRMKKIEWLLATNLRLQPGFEHSFCVAPEGRVTAMGFWTRNDTPEPGVMTKLRSGLLIAPLNVGRLGMRRLQEVIDGMLRDRIAALEKAPYWFLNNMVVDESLRGTGVGSELLADQLRSIEQHDPGATFALATQRRENLVFYGRLGFEVAVEAVIGQGPDAFINWIMQRRAG